MPKLEEITGELKETTGTKEAKEKAESREETKGEEISSQGEADTSKAKSEDAKTSSTDTRATDSSIPVFGERASERDSRRCVIKGMDPVAFVDLLEKYLPDQISGRTVALAPVTFRFLTKKNTYAMLTASRDGDDTQVHMAGFNTGEDHSVLDEITAAYEAATSNRSGALAKEKADVEKAEETRKAQVLDRELRRVATNGSKADVEAT